jgi:hypothetical protein
VSCDQQGLLPDEHRIERAEADFGGEIMIGHDLLELAL